MNNASVLPLRSSQLASYTQSVPCYLCQTVNTFDVEFCTCCSAPMALAHQAKGRKVSPQMVAVVGASAVGKTVYLGMLIDMLTRQQRPLHLLTRGAFSLALQQTTVAALARCEFPPKTPTDPERWNWVHGQIRQARKRQPTELILCDMAGDALMTEVDHPHSYRVIRQFLQRSAAAIVLIDAMEISEGSRRQDFFAMKLLSYLSELETDVPGWSQRPVALVLTKADQCEECLANAAGFARTHAVGLWQHCRERFCRHQFFAASVAGACAWRESATEGRRQVPLRIEPRGIIEPLEWLLAQRLGARG